MSGIMNNYFYGKAGQADYTVEQMPTNRKQLFFTTLRVRLSSMVGVNLLNFLFMLPLLIWLFLGLETSALYTEFNDDTSQDTIDSLRSVEPAVVAEYEQYAAADYKFKKLLEKYGSEDAIEEAFKSAEKISFIEEIITQIPAETEDGETLTKTETKAYEFDKAQWDAIKTDRVEHYTNYYNGLTQARNSNILTTLIIAIPLFMIASVGRPGMMYILRNWARDEHAFIWQDFKAAIKNNWKQSLPLGFLNGLSFVLFFVAWHTYGDMASSSSWLFAIPQGLMVVLLIIWWMMYEVIYVMMVTYEMKLRTLIRNSILITIARLPVAFVILLGTVAVPVLLSFLPQPFSLLVLLLLYALLGFALVGFVQASFANSCFDRFLNPRIEGAEVNKGLYKPDAEEEEAQDEPSEPVREERYWEHKTK